MVNVFTTTWGVLSRISTDIVSAIPLIAWVIVLTTKDFGYTLLALLTPKRPVGQVIKEGRPGYAGLWPEFAAPLVGDSRSPCPGLNTLANHGILPRDGRKITYKQFSEAIQHAYNLSPTLGDQLTASAELLDQGRGWIDLHDLNCLNIVQHDASFTRPDIAFCPDQSHPHVDLVEHFLSHSTDGKTLSISDLVYFSGLRRAECKASNGQYSLSYSFLHKFFGSGNAALLYSVFGGDVADLRVFLGEERFPEGWEPRNRESIGHTILFAQKTTIDIEFNINENQKLRPGDSFHARIPMGKGAVV